MRQIGKSAQDLGAGCMAIDVGRRVVVIAATALLAACASAPKLAPQPAAKWEDTECAKLEDEAERARCVERAGVGYDEYVRQQKEAAKAAK
ncbi:hypothetical protein [Niveibacterium sp. SC-1]|uniref:hypothetical protein n=1 Tax=Niveibacterium sp. SC-1 TaxID=3135646 RepID=UPI00311EB014